MEADAGGGGATPEAAPTAAAPGPADPSLKPAALARCALGGVLMGLANLVPGISGGTMLLASGVYRRFINAIAEATRLRPRPAVLATLAFVGAPALATFVFGAGPVKWLVVEHRWAMYALFIGLTLGGAPLVIRPARPTTPAFWAGAAVGFLLLAAPAVAAFAGVEPGGGSRDSMALVFVGGVAAAAAMILPGVSGGYLLLLLGLYVAVLGAISDLSAAVLALDASALADPLRIAAPFGLGMVVGIGVVSNGLRWLLRAHAQPTLGVLLGLLIGAVVGLWPFQAVRTPEVGELLKGQEVLSIETREADGRSRPVAVTALDELERDDWPTAFIAPTPGRTAAVLGLIVVGLGVTRCVAMVGDGGPKGEGG